jgi:hypothetical protein
MTPSGPAPMSEETSDFLRRQFDTAWQLTAYHLEGLTTDECLWRPAARGLHVHHDPGAGAWRADWPEHEGYDLGPPSIGWLTWHMVFWWSMVLDHSFGDATLTREQVGWPGDADGVRATIEGLRARWGEHLGAMTDADLGSTGRSRWPIEGRPFGDIVAWASLELMKNASEIGYARFLYAVRAR